MDFSGQYSFPGAPAYSSFMPIPPLTPSHSQSAASDEFNNTSPPDAFDALPRTDQFNNFDYTQGFNPPQQTQQPQQQHTSAFPGPPTPPNHAAFGQQQQQRQQSHQALSRNGSVNGGNLSAQGQMAKPEPNMDVGGSDDEENMTPAQSRRKAQNRAAQRAFRERKERHVKDLETKLASMEAAQQQASVENERLKRDLQKMSTENEILRATSVMGNGHSSRSPEPLTTGPMHYKPTDFYSNVLQNHQNKSPSHRIVTSDDGERLLAAGATWDFIISHDLYKKGLVDVGDVSERLKHCARCDGQGPVFSESTIVSAIEQSVASGTDDLL